MLLPSQDRPSVLHVVVMCPAFLSPCPRLELRLKNQLGLQTDPMNVFCHFVVRFVCSLWIHASYTNIQWNDNFLNL